MTIGLLFMNMNTINQLKSVDGSSLSIVTETTNFVKGEKIIISLVNSGTTSLQFDKILFKITSLDGRLLYSLSIKDQTIYLNPQDTKILIWNQTKNDGNFISAGRYKITSSALDPLNNVITTSEIVNINNLELESENKFSASPTEKNVNVINENKSTKNLRRCKNKLRTNV